MFNLIDYSFVILLIIKLIQIKSGIMKTVVKIDGMSCQHCVMEVKKEIQKLEIKNLEVKIGEASVEFDEKILSEDDIIQAIVNAGYIVVK